MNGIEIDIQPRRAITKHSVVATVTVCTILSRQRAWRRTQSLTVPAAWEAPSHHPDQGSSVQARLLPFHADAADQAHVASTPDTAWPVSGHPPGSSRNHLNAPVSMPS